MTHNLACAARSLIIGATLCSNARALGEPQGPAPLPAIVVIGTTPVPGLRVDADKVPGNVQSLFSADLYKADGTANLTGSLNTQLASVTINDTLADQFQPDILYRGFEASPVLGTPQGLAVYQNGVRINEAFGDSVNWDLIPDIAIDRVDLVSSSPLYGLNALGGALSVTMKNGFTYQGLDGALSGGVVQPAYRLHGSRLQPRHVRILCRRPSAESGRLATLRARFVETVHHGGEPARRRRHD